MYTGIHLDIYEIDLDKTWYSGRYHFNYISLSNLIWLHFWKVIALGVRKHKLVCQLSHKVFSSLGYNLVCCWDMLVWYTSLQFSLLLSSACTDRRRGRTQLSLSSKVIHLMHINFDLIRSLLKGENPAPVILIKKIFDAGLCSNMYRPISFKFIMMLDSTEILSLMQILGQCGWFLVCCHGLLVCCSCLIYWHDW